MALSPLNMTRDILDFYGLSFDDKVKEYLDTHTERSDVKLFSTFRNSKKIPFHWIKKLTFDEVEDIQNNCKEAMDLYGYKMAESASELSNDFVPFIAFSGLK